MVVILYYRGVILRYRCTNTISFVVGVPSNLSFYKQIAGYM